jgi:AcrR family transcriptional regulator
MPRPYRLGKRGDDKAETRARIVQAAVALYREGGARLATTRAIALRADVAAATVQNHFPKAGDLADAAADAILEELRPPGPAIFADLDALDDRIDRLAHELAAFYIRGEPWWRIFTQDEALGEAWAGAQARYSADVDVLLRAALGPRGDDDTALAVLSSVVGPPVFFGLRARGMSADEAANHAVALIVPWLKRRDG